MKIKTFFDTVGRFEIFLLKFCLCKWGKDFAADLYVRAQLQSTTWCQSKAVHEASCQLLLWSCEREGRPAPLPCLMV